MCDIHPECGSTAFGIHRPLFQICPCRLRRTLSFGPAQRPVPGKNGQGASLPTLDCAGEADARTAVADALYQSRSITSHETASLSAWLRRRAAIPLAFPPTLLPREKSIGFMEADGSGLAFGAQRAHADGTNTLQHAA
jgi:hypothetical protein